MKALSLHALFPADRLDVFGALRLPEEELQTCVFGGLAALFGRARTIDPADRRALGVELVSFQRLLEALLPLGPVLPAAFDCRFAHRDALDAFLIGHASKLRKALIEFGGRRQHQIRIKGGAPTWAHEFETILRAACVDVLLMPREDKDTLLNAAVLIEADGGARLDAALEDIDAFDSAALRIKNAGPLPACAFASVRAEALDAETVDAACRRLAVARRADPPEINAAYRAIMKVTHPDALKDDYEPGADTAARAARDLLLRVREAELALDRAGRAFAAPPAVLRFARADSSGLAA